MAECLLVSCFCMHRRQIFNWTHRTVGFMAHALGGEWIGDMMWGQ